MTSGPRPASSAAVILFQASPHSSTTTLASISVSVLSCLRRSSRIPRELGPFGMIQISTGFATAGEAIAKVVKNRRSLRPAIAPEHTPRRGPSPSAPSAPEQEPHEAEADQSQESVVAGGASAHR